MKVRAALLFLPLLLAGCGERAPRGNAVGGSTTPPYVRGEGDASSLKGAMLPVRVGEQGPSFAACNGRGATRDWAGAEPVPVRGGPYEQSEEIDRLQPGTTFFICARTHDQRWSGIVYDEGGEASARCAVSAPLPAPRNYAGPCAAGWVPSARVRLVSGVPHQLPPGAAPAQ